MYALSAYVCVHIKYPHSQFMCAHTVRLKSGFCTYSNAQILSCSLTMIIQLALLIAGSFPSCSASAHCLPPCCHSNLLAASAGHAHPKWSGGEGLGSIQWDCFCLFSACSRLSPPSLASLSSPILTRSMAEGQTHCQALSL